MQASKSKISLISYFLSDADFILKVSISYKITFLKTGVYSLYVAFLKIFDCWIGFSQTFIIELLC